MEGKSMATCTYTKIYVSIALIIGLLIGPNSPVYGSTKVAEEPKKLIEGTQEVKIKTFTKLQTQLKEQQKIFDIKEPKAPKELPDILKPLSIDKRIGAFVLSGLTIAISLLTGIAFLNFKPLLTTGLANTFLSPISLITAPIAGIITGDLSKGDLYQVAHDAVYSVSADKEAYNKKFTEYKKRRRQALQQIGSIIEYTAQEKNLTPEKKQILTSQCLETLLEKDGDSIIIALSNKYETKDLVKNTVKKWITSKDTSNHGPAFSFLLTLKDNQEMNDLRLTFLRHTQDSTDIKNILKQFKKNTTTTSALCKLARNQSTPLPTIKGSIKYLDRVYWDNNPDYPLERNKLQKEIQTTIVTTFRNITKNANAHPDIRKQAMNELAELIYMIDEEKLSNMILSEFENIIFEEQENNDFRYDVVGIVENILDGWKMRKDGRFLGAEGDEIKEITSLSGIGLKTAQIIVRLYNEVNVKNNQQLLKNFKDYQQDNLKRESRYTYEWLEEKNLLDDLNK